jgi:two-component system cell cycle sensor histidine kinase/response regulator CckA
MMEAKPLNVAIVGGGPGCKAIMDMIFAEKLSQLHMKLVGVAGTNPDAIGYRYAQEKGIYTTTDYRDLYGLKDLDMIIELTRREGLANEIFQNKPEDIRLMDHVAARVFWDVFRIEEERIAERRRSEEATKLAYAELHQIFETSADGMRVIDREFNVLRVNQSFEALSDMKKDEAIGKKCYEVFGGPLCHTPGCPLTRILGGEERIERDAEKERKDGTRVSCIVTATAFREPGGEFVGIVEDFKDITERKRSEEALRESERKYRNLVDNALVGVYKTNMKGDILYVNEALAKAMEFGSPEELMSESVLARYKDLKDRDALIDALEKHGRLVNFEFELLTKTGRTRQAILTAIRDEDAISGMVLDVTDLKQAEEALEAERRRLYSVLDGLPAFVCLLAPDYSIRFANRFFRDRFGDPGGRLCYEVLGKYKEPCEECQTFHVFETTSPKEWEWKAFDGRTYQVYDYPFSDVDGLPLVLELGIDITEHKRLEAQLQQAQKMEAIGTLAGGIAHDFNNVLMAIQGHTSLVLLHTETNHPYFEHLRGIEDMVQKGADLTRQLLGFARGGKYEVKPTDLNQLVEKSCDMFGRTKKEINVHTKYQEEVWPVEVDQAQIEQVLLNLYVNAWQAMPNGGDLYVETAHVVLDEDYARPYGVDPGRYVKISVTDTGVGMDKATQQRIFDPFFTTKEMGRGTGLGLASAYGIVQNHGGIINVYSEVGKGATFTIYLPASEKEIPVEETRLADEILRGTETILLVDDEDEVLGVGEKMLKEMGYEVFVARSGKDAIKIYGKQRDEICLVILDMIMPEMGGGETYDRMKETNPNVKVLLSSGYSIDGQAAEILKRGCDGFIQKPFSVKELSREVREILDKEEAVDASQ